MKRLKEKLTNKLRSQSGESIGETLVALLISALALVMLAGAMTSALGMITKSRNKLNSYYDAENNVVTRTNGTQLNNGITITDKTYVISPASYNITYYVDSEFSNTPVIAYKKQ